MDNFSASSSKAAQFENWPLRDLRSSCYCARGQVASPRISRVVSCRMSPWAWFGLSSTRAGFWRHCEGKGGELNERSLVGTVIVHEFQYQKLGAIYGERIYHSIH